MLETIGGESVLEEGGWPFVDILVRNVTKRGWDVFFAVRVSRPSGPDVLPQDRRGVGHAEYRRRELSKADAHGASPAGHPSGVNQQPEHGHVGLGHVKG